MTRRIRRSRSVDLEMIGLIFGSEVAAVVAPYVPPSPPRSRHLTDEEREILAAESDGDPNCLGCRGTGCSSCFRY